MSEADPGDDDAERGRPDQPRSIDETGEYPAPPGGLTPPGERRARQRENTRTVLAWAMFVLLALIVLTGLVGWLFFDATREEMETLVLVYAPVVTLMGTILGFYYASSRE